MMRSSTVAVSRRQIRKAAVSLAAFATVFAVAARAQANCAELAGRTLHRAPVRIGPETGSAASGASAYRLFYASLENSEPAITGLWHLEFLVDGAVVDSAFETFTADGNELMVDTTPPSLGNVCNGIWVRTGRQAYKVKHPSFLFNPDGSVSGTAIFRTDVRLAKGGRSFTGHTTIGIYDMDGDLVDQVTGDVRATRIVVD